MQFVTGCCLKQALNKAKRHFIYKTIFLLNANLPPLLYAIVCHCSSTMKMGDLIRQQFRRLFEPNVIAVVVQLL